MGGKRILKASDAEVLHNSEAEGRITMKKRHLLFVLLVAMQMWALDKALITVKDGSVNNGVVIVNIRDAVKFYELQCNKSVPDCRVPEPGTYWMVRLPKNHGMYECANVDLYPQSVDPESHDKLLGEYCLIEK